MAAIAVGCSHVSGLLVQPLFTTAGPDVVREVGPNHEDGLDTRDPRRFSPLDARPINIMPSAPPQPVTLTAYSSRSGVAIVRRRCGRHPIAKLLSGAAHASARYWGAR